MGRKAPRVVPRGRLDETEEDHSPSALALTAKFPVPPPVSTPDEATAAAAERPVEEKIFGPASRIGNRKLTEDIDPWSFNAWSGFQGSATTIADEV